MANGDKYVPNGVWLRCDKGAIPGKLTILPKTIKLYGQDWAAQYEAVPMVNIPAFGACLVTKVVCVPGTVQWSGVQSDVRLLGQNPILDTSTCQCSFGGTVKIYFTKAAVDAAGADFQAEREAKDNADLLGKVALGLLAAAVLTVVVVGTGGTALAVIATAAAIGGAAGAVGGAVQGGITGGAEGAAKGFLVGGALGALGGVAVAVGGPAGLLALGSGVAGLGSVGFLGKAYYHNPSEENGRALVGAVAGIIAGGLTAKGLSVATAPKTSTIYRAQGGVPPNASRSRVQISEEGNASISGDGMLHVGIDNKTHAVYFYNKRGGAAAGGEITSFKIPKTLADQIRREAVPQKLGRQNPNSPQIDDPKVGPDLYGLPKVWIDRINQDAIKGSGKTEKP